MPLVAWTLVIKHYDHFARFVDQIHPKCALSVPAESQLSSIDHQPNQSIEGFAANCGGFFPLQLMGPDGGGGTRFFPVLMVPQQLAKPFSAIGVVFVDCVDFDGVPKQFVREKWLVENF